MLYGLLHSQTVYWKNVIFKKIGIWIFVITHPYIGKIQLLVAEWCRDHPGYATQLRVTSWRTDFAKKKLIICTNVDEK